MKDYTFPIPAALIGDQLRDELGAEKVWIDGDLLFIRGDFTEAEAVAGIKAHIPAEIVPPTPAERLFAATGLTVAEYKALGL